jgi:hypothetical protein
MNNKNNIDTSYLTNDEFNMMPEDTQNFVIMLMCLLRDAHRLEIDHNQDIRLLLRAYSPNNKLLKSEAYISWGEGLHSLIADIIQGKGFHSPTDKSKAMH